MAALLLLVGIAAPAAYAQKAAAIGEAVAAANRSFAQASAVNPPATNVLGMSNANVSVPVGQPVVSVGSGNSAAPVTPVPEPEIYAMLTLGLGLLGFLVRRKR